MSGGGLFSNSGVPDLGDLVRVLLDPAGLRVQAPHRLVTIAGYLPSAIQQHGAAAAAALVDP